MDIKVNKNQTTEFLSEIREKLRKGISYSDADYFARRLGAHVDGTTAHFLLWHPIINTAEKVFIECFIPVSDLIYDKPDQHSNVTYYRFEAGKIGEFAAVVIDNLPAGNRERFGAFYQYLCVQNDGSKTILRDPMAWSVPYGIHAPAELYDVVQILDSRKDTSYYKSLEKSFSKTGTNRAEPATNLLEIHTGTATMDGTLQSLAKRYQQIASSIHNNIELSPDEKNLIGFDGIELMPVNPVIEHPENHSFWSAIQTPENHGSEITVHLRKPVVTNWGYDTAIFGSAAINPSILTTGRPHELLNLIETLHNFPTGPIKIILDVVYAHADNQALDILPEVFFAGPNMYGQNVNYKHPLVRAIVLEILRRKLNWGIDGIRVDSAQNFKYYDAEQDLLIHDDDFLKQISAVKLQVADVSFKPWVIFEDARPWPRNDWELASTYQEIIHQQKHPYQWGPMIFAYNTPYHYTYWVSKWWRLKELFEFGDQWISGYANHDTMRRGTQADPETINVNFLLGNSLKMVMESAYNNPSTTLLMNAFLPGVPMDFLQALGNTPWSFFRNTDAKFGIKITAEEAYFTEWQITDIEYRNTRFFKKLKNYGFRSLSDLRRFSKALHHFVKATDYNPENIVTLLNQVDPPFAVEDWTLKKLTDFTQAWMADIFEYCNIDMHTDYIDTRKADFNLMVREYRLANPWLNKHFGDEDFLRYREPVNGTVIYYGYRKNKSAGKELIFLANMEGQPRQVIPTKLNLPVGDVEGWNVALSTPSVRAKRIDQPIRLSISQSILFERNV
jgi:hypothetical protein